jgi:GTP-binding protein Era
MDKHSGYCAIVGRPNVGKSTLINRLIGQKLAITSRKPQTTRHSIIGVKTREDGQIVYVDTPGIHQRGEQAMNRYLNRTAKSALAGVDLLLFVVAAMKWTAEDQAVLDTVERARIPVILVINKVDRVKDKTQLLPFIAATAARGSFVESVPLSALRGDNVALLEQQVVRLLPRGEAFFPDDQLTDRSERFFAAELLREQLTRRYAKEIPYALSVEIERFEEHDNSGQRSHKAKQRDASPLINIAAVIWVERPGQKNIIIGRKGEALREVATQARLEMEKFFQRRVYLDVWVKVKRSWSSDESALIQLGYGD